MTVLDDLCLRLTAEIEALLKAMPKEELAALEEIRVYLNRPVEFVIAGTRKRTGLIADNLRMDNLLALLSGNALYRFERQMAEGYIPLEGGHRAGICGAMVRMEDGSWRMNRVTSVCIRIARSIKGASSSVRRHFFAQNGRVRRILLLGAPGCGKTTLLRDAALYMARHVRVAAADEREELFNGLGCRETENLDVLSGTDKSRAFSMLIRTMAPQVIVCDELGRDEDVYAVLDAARCGVGMLASAHADGLDDLLMRPVLRKAFEAGVFERYIHLERHCVKAVWDGTGHRMDDGEGVNDGKLGDGSHGDDWCEQHWIFPGGRREKACPLDTGHAQVSFAAGRCHSL